MPRRIVTVNVTKSKSEKPVGERKKAPQLKPYQFKPGQSGNPSGRPKGSGSKLISIAYTKALEQPLPEEIKEKLGLEGDVTWADAIALQTVRQAVEGPAQKLVNADAVTELREVTEGKIPDKVEATGKDGAPLVSAPPVINVGFVKAKDGKPSNE